MVKNPPAYAGDAGSIPGSGRSPGEGNGNPIQYSCLGYPMDRGAWQATCTPCTPSHKSRTRLTKPPPMSEIGLSWLLSWWLCCLPSRRLGFCLWVAKIPWRRKWQPNPVFLPGKSHEQRSLEGYSPWGHKELETTE